MSSKRLVSVRALLFVAALAVPALVPGLRANAQTAARPVASAAEEESAPLKNDASHQGIKVHGHWKIVVKNPDGSIAETREFENSLTSTGAIAVGGILSGKFVSAGHAILLQATGSSTSLCGNTTCGIVPGSTVGPFTNLCGGGLPAAQLPISCVTGETETNPGGSSTITLAGQVTASQAGTITTVATIVAFCSNATTPTACSTSTSATDYSFTSATLPTPISVASGQSVQVTVTFTFA